MNVMLIGGCSSMINNLIIKLNKEGHRVYLISGNRYDKSPYQKVFERFDFPYDCNCLSEIFRGINLDLTIFMGAYDTNFDWKQEEKEAVRYSCCMANILMSYAMRGLGRFVYLSSEEVYGASYEEDIPEDMPVSPKGYKGMALVQAEELCESYRKNCGLDIITLRVDHLYSIPKAPKDVTDVCSKMCLEALDTYTMTINENNEFSMLFERDAVEYIYRVGASRKHNSSLYHISSCKEVTERQIAEMIQKVLGFEAEIMVASRIAKRKILSNRLYESEFGNPFFCEMSVIIKQIVDEMKKNRQVFLHGEEQKETLYQRLTKKAGWLLKALIPFVENLIAFVPFFMLNNRAVGSEYFANLDFYLLYVLLFAIVYGQQQAAVSAVLSVLGYCFRQMYDRSSLEIMLDANTYVWIAQLFILGLVVGYMRDNITKLRKESENEREFLTLQLHDIQDINSSHVRVKDALETQIINQNDSVGKIYSITSALEQYSPDEVLFYAAEMIGKLVKSKDVAIYMVSNADYARLFSSTSGKARMLGNSIRYAEMGEMYETLMEQKVFINRKLDEKYPLMANAIFDDQDVMQMIVMIWSIPWESMTLGQANQLTVISALIHNAVLRANRYIAALDEKRYIEGTKALDTEAFRSMVRAYVQAERKGLTECTILKVSVHLETKREESKEIDALLRQSDYIGTLEGEWLYILLTNTTCADAQYVIDRLAARGYECSIIEEDAEWMIK